MSVSRFSRRTLLAGAAALALAGPAAAKDPARRKAIDAAATPALKQLLAENRFAAALAKKAHAHLIFPKITKVGLIIGGGAGDGVLRIRGKSVAYYEHGGVSIGLQAGVQTYGYVLMFQSKEALTKFQAKSGFALGADASVLVVDAGGSGVADTTNQKVDIVAFIFDEAGVMLKLSVAGTTYTKLDI
jgi:lipid-binding SYLF domain-containing protein